MESHQLTFTRFIACFVVIVSHFGFYGDNQIIYPLNLIPNYGVFNYGGLAVLYFFILSGFVLSISNKKKFTSYNVSNVTQFWFLRIIRIYPVYLLSLFFLLVLSSRGFYDNQLEGWEWFQNFSLTQSWYDGKSITEPYMLNGASWSLSVELIFYLLCPFFFFLIDNKFIRIGLLLLTPLYFVISDLPLIRENNWYLLLLYNQFFIIGLIAGHYYSDFKALFKNTKGYLTSLILVVATVSLVVLTMKYDISSWYKAAFILPTFTLLILAIASFKSPILSLYRSKFFLKLGEISYTMFLFQAPVYRYLELRFFNADDPTERFWKSLLILTILSYFIYELFENPLRLKVKKLITKINAR